MHHERPSENGISRKQFVCSAAAALCAAGCAGLSSGGTPRVINAGPAGRYAAEGVYSEFLAVGFFLIKKQGHLTALSSYCTHRHCKLEAEPDRSFYCDCHGSRFDPTGHVTEGPASKDLPQLPLVIDRTGQVLVTVT